MQQTKRATGLALAALAVALSVPATAFAGPKFEALEKGVPVNVTDARQILDAFLKQLGTDTAAIKAVQAECGLVQTGANETKTQACLREHAEIVARARQQAAAAVADLERELAVARRGGARLARIDPLRKPEFTPIADVSDFASRSCPPGTQVRFFTPHKFTCADAVYDVRTEAECARAPVDTACRPGITALGVDYGRQDVVPIPPPVSFPEIPEPPGTCDGVGGALLCYGLPIVGVVALGFYVGHVIQTGDFAPVTVQR